MQARPEEPTTTFRAMGLLGRLALRAARSAVRNPRVASTVVPVAEHLVLAARGFSYDPRRNGELDLLQRAVSAVTIGRFIFFDVGANFGGWTELVLDALGDRPHEGHLLEPTPSTFEMLSHRYSHVDALQLSRSALSSSVAKREFLDIAPASGQNTLVTASHLEGKTGPICAVATRTATTSARRGPSIASPC